MYPARSISYPPAPARLEDALGRNQPRKKNRSKKGDVDNLSTSPDGVAPDPPSEGENQTTIDEHIEATKNGSVEKSVGSRTVKEAIKEEKAEDSNDEVSFRLNETSSLQTKRGRPKKSENGKLR